MTTPVAGPKIEIEEIEEQELESLKKDDSDSIQQTDRIANIENDAFGRTVAARGK
jgi:hypothetical protein